MEDGPPGNLTTSERLDLLKRYEASWKNLEWTEHNTASSIPSRFRDWESYANVLACRHGGDGEAIDFIQLPSRLCGISLRKWTLRFSFVVREFGVDSSQDLLVTIEGDEKYVRWSLYKCLF